MLSSPRSIASSLWPPFATAVDYLKAWCDYLNLRGTITSGFRSLEEQAKLYAIGRTPAEIAGRVSKQGKGGSVTDAPPGTSAHNYGLAVDIEGPDQASIIQLAKAMGFGTVSWDPAHVEWPNWRTLIS